MGISFKWGTLESNYYVDRDRLLACMAVDGRSGVALTWTDLTNRKQIEIPKNGTIHCV